MPLAARKLSTPHLDVAYGGERCYSTIQLRSDAQRTYTGGTIGPSLKALGLELITT